jgi:alpha-L-fucosidase 2
VKISFKKITTLLAALVALAADGTAAQEQDLKLWYDAPASRWVEALPVGNGRLGAMVFGGTAQERIQLNEETIWAGQPNDNINPDALAALPEVRRLMFEGKFTEAQNLVNREITNGKKRNHGMSYQPAGNLRLEFAGHEKPTAYYRELDIATAIATTRYTVDGVEYTREVFASFCNNVIVVRLSASQKGKINFTAWFDTPHPPERSATRVVGNTLTLSGLAGTQEKLEGKVAFLAESKIMHDRGTLTNGTDGKIIVANADSATIYTAIATNFVNYRDISGDAGKIAREYLWESLKKTYARQREIHIENYKKYFDRVKLDLGTTDAAKQPTDERVLKFADGTDPQLVALYFQFGRYLLISSSQPGGQAATLQGIWNESLSPAWDSKYTTNINAEMNYWPAEVTNLAELHKPFIALIKDLAASGTETASRMYGTRGWVLHHNTDIWRLTGPIDGAGSGMWPTGGAWVSQHLWERYLYSGDKTYLAEIYPVLKGAALFFLDFLVEEPSHKWLVVAPSCSPENAFLRNGYITNTYGVTMDNQLLFELFTNTAAAAETLGTDADFAATLKATRARLAPMHIGQHSQLQEWLHDWDKPTDHHRHVSHLYGLYPSWQISPYRTPELFDAARTSLNYRGDPATGWSMGWKVCFWARFQDGDRALKLIREQLRLSGSPKTKHNGGGTYPNLFDAHPPFQIDGNFGCAAGIAEMLMQSHDGALHILPALPRAWPKGKITGLRARGGFEVSIEWADGTAKTVRVKSHLGGNLRLRTPDALVRADGTALQPAKDANPNAFFKTTDIPAPIISEKAKLNPPAVKPVVEYDIPTEPEKEYVFTAK